MGGDKSKTAERSQQIASLQRSQANSYQELMARAAAYLALDCAEEALDDYEQAIKLKGSEVQAHIKRFAVLTRLALTERMLGAAQELIAIAPRKSIGYFYNGLALSQSGREKESIDAYTRAIELAPDDAASYVNRAAGYSSLGLVKKALADCERAQSINPELVSPYINKAVALRGMGKLDEAIQVCNAALWLDPQQPLAYCNRAMANFAMKLDRQALQDIDQSINFSRDPKYAAKCKAIKAHFLALLSGGQGGGGGGNDSSRNDNEEGRLMLNEARELCDNASRLCTVNSYPWRYTWTVSALISALMGDFASAEANVQRVLDRHSGFTFGINIKARILLLQDRLNEALAAVDSALALNPDEPESNYLRYLVRSRKMDPGASQDLDRALRLGYLRNS